MPAAPSVCRILWLSGMLVIAYVASTPVFAQRALTNNEHSVVNTHGFLNAHPDLLYRLRGFELIKSNQFDKAAIAFQRAALYADKPSQAYVAGMHWEGMGVPRNRSLAYAWMDLAAERGYPDFIAMREKMWGEMSESERARALHEGNSIYARYGDDVANPRLARELRRQRMEVVGSRTGSMGMVKVRIPLPMAGGAASDPGASAAYMTIDGSQFYADKFWEPRQYQAWLEAQWKEPRGGRVEVGALKQDKSVPASRVKDKKDAPGKP